MSNQSAPRLGCLFLIAASAVLWLMFAAGWAMCLLYQL